VIASAGFVRAAHWAPGGTIVYTTSDRGARLMAVSLSGGAPTPLATVSTLPRAPRLLPDGQHLLYFDRTARQIRVASRDGRSDEVVTDATSGAIYVDGRLLFLRENALLAQPFDLSRRVLTGTAQAVARDVQSLLGESTGIFSASETGLLLYQDGAAESATSLAWFDRDGKRQATVRETGSARGLFLSPDDRVAAMGTTDPQGRTDLWAVDLPTGAIRRLTFDTESGDVSTFVAWASDRLSIAYATRKGDQSTVVRHPVTGGAAEPLFVVPAEDLRRWGVPRVTSWTKDGRDILYSGESTGGIWRQSITAAPGGPPANAPSALYPGNGQNPRLSPNQRWASFQASPEGVTVSGIFVDAFPGGGKRQQVADKGTLALWSDDGKFLYYAADNVLTIVEVTETDEAIRFGPPRALMPVMIGRGYSYDVASDGRILALVTSDKRASQPLTLVQHWARALDDK
jgi:hypothetical protein